MSLATFAHAQVPAQPVQTQAPAAILKLLELFNVKAPFAQMADKLEYLRNCFTLVGITAVMISAIRRVAKARTSDESMGWVASVVLTIGLMAAAPKIGNQIYQAADSLAESSKFTNANAIATCWDSLIQLLPGESPMMESLQDVNVGPATPKDGPVMKEDASWTKMAWSYMKEAWVSMTNALSSITGAFRSVVNRAVVLILIIIPAIALLLGMLAITIGEMGREFLHQTMDVFLPMMIAFASFAPMRGPSANFITKYISISLWPIGWAIGNGIAISLLSSLMAWIIEVCRRTLETASDAHTPVVIRAGIVMEAASNMPWVMIIVIAFFLLICASMILVSAVAAPKAMNAMLTKGVEFVGAQMSEASALARTMNSMAQAPAPPTMAGGSVVNVSSIQSRIVSSAAIRAGASMTAASGKLSNVAAAGGPVGVIAAAAAMVLARAGQAATSVASGGSSQSSNSESGDVGRVFTDVGGSRFSIARLGSGESPALSPATTARAHRRLPIG
ncbi:MAG TPA: hypothetical protein VFT72_19425 [Opitutaceae bacterium]|nr:hypothetical protein [Opitutaceae bacterium]